MQAIRGTPGLFRLQLTQYWDATQSVPGNQDESVILRIYRKQNPVLIQKVQVPLQETLPLTFDNVACATLRQLSFTQARYYATYQFNPSVYNDPGGYYMVWERCCRNDALTNVNTTLLTGVAMAFYLEFPPMTRSGVTVTNSSPVFKFPNGDYICINNPFTFDVGATDADGDQLRYSLVTPLNGYTTSTAPTDFDDSPKASYPTITWAPGYSLSNIIPGNPPLTINPTTGQLTVRASKEGLFLFTVQCEEFRNGERIGVVRRDFQLPVVDCSKNTPPAAVVLANGKEASDLVWCGSQPLVLSVEANSDWAYQWQKDGENIRGATSDTLQVRVPGMYTVVKSLANSCANDTTSQAVKVTYVTAPAVKIGITSPEPYCTGDTIRLEAAGQSNYQYQWQQDGKDIDGARQAILGVYQSGVYSVLAKPANAVCDGTDTARITINPKPDATIKAPRLSFCADDSTTLTVNRQIGDRYLWQRNGAKLSDTTALLTVRQSGTYQVTVMASTGCAALSAPINVNRYERPTVLFDSIPPICANSSNVVTLRGQPVGGTFDGPGVSGTRFDPKSVGAGTYQLTYTVVSDTVCQTRTSQRVEVVASPNVSGQTRYTMTRGGSVQLLTQADQPIRTYQWEPPTSLDQPTVASPTASPAETTTYQVTVTSAEGCTTIFSVLVDVSTPLYIPTAFSPNADGNNDVWLLSNISAFPQCEVSVFNRWGELIFYSKGYAQPWDGTYKQQLVQTGVYTYQIKTGNDPLAHIYRGQLTVLH
ncbi:gliding motility-associated C-terminal domain-containing protein [Spirosoma aerolatum]|uniref:gliding motility-associated C-terminal domain-containing protein n=1 Tax=Spirosoma aerolatum TaxID=1211326 RepID=UPI0009AF0DDB|nr:gliding motility-associated C-terminal domain-containing protein [Spirosoma aerolatum]